MGDDRQNVCIWKSHRLSGKLTLSIVERKLVLIIPGRQLYFKNSKDPPRKYLGAIHISRPEVQTQNATLGPPVPPTREWVASIGRAMELFKRNEAYSAGMSLTTKKMELIAFTFCAGIKIFRALINITSQMWMGLHNRICVLLFFFH